MTVTTLPAVFGDLGQRVAHVRRVNAGEYSSECPRCGSTGHQGSDPPDRCRWFTEAGRERVWCRRCGFFMWADQMDGAEPLSAEELAWRRLEERRIAAARQQETERRAEQLRQGRAWERYHADMPDHGRAYWRARGIPDSLQDFWQLGWCADYALWHDGHEVRTPTATIPLFDADWRLLNVKHRLVQPPQGVGKYRYEIPGPQPLFLVDPGAPLTGRVIAVEGEIKAMVLAQAVDKNMGVVVGLPGVRVGSHIIASLAQAERVTLVTDPGSERQAIDLAKRIGVERTRLLIPFEKIDDAIVCGGLPRRVVAHLLETAVPLARLMHKSKG